jgi:hypothetical protein
MRWLKAQTDSEQIHYQVAPYAAPEKKRQAGMVMKITFS